MTVSKAASLKSYEELAAAKAAEIKAGKLAAELPLPPKAPKDPECKASGPKDRILQGFGAVLSLKVGVGLLQFNGR